MSILGKLDFVCYSFKKHRGFQFSLQKYFFLLLLDDVSVQCISCKDDGFTANVNESMTIQYTINADWFNTLKLKYNNTRLFNVVERTGIITKFTNDSRWVFPEKLTKLKVKKSSTFNITLINLSINDNDKEISYEYNDKDGVDHLGSTKLTVIGK